jgi:hypothetical protein
LVSFLTQKHLIMFFGGFGSLITAVVMLVASTRHGREHAVNDFSHRISNWTHYRQQLQVSVCAR